MRMGSLHYPGGTSSGDTRNEELDSLRGSAQLSGDVLQSIVSVWFPFSQSLVSVALSHKRILPSDYYKRSQYW